MIYKLLDAKEDLMKLPNDFVDILVIIENQLQNN